MFNIAPAVEAPKVDAEEEEEEPEDSFLGTVYLQKSPYIIRDSSIEQIGE
jgi:hypothetical protein